MNDYSLAIKSKRNIIYKKNLRDVHVNVFNLQCINECFKISVLKFVKVLITNYLNADSVSTFSTLISLVIAPPVIKNHQESPF